MKKQFEGKNIVITGASRGIGRSISLQLAKENANLYLIARTPGYLAELRELIKEKHPDIHCSIYSADVGDKDQVAKSVAEIAGEIGGIDGLINNAGTSQPRYFSDIPFDEFERIMQVDYMGSVYVTKCLFPHFRKNSFVSFTSSVAGFMGVFGYTSYTGPKFALIGFAESLRQELKPRGIRVSVLCPPDTKTPGFEQEETTKPMETRWISEKAKLLDPETVARRFLKQLAAGKFLITVNFESKVLYRINGMFPGLVRRSVDGMVRKARKGGD